MSLGLLAFLASLPIVVIVGPMVVMRWPATRAMPAAWIFTFLLAAFVWRTPLDYLVAATIRGVFSAVEILLIVFGALVLLFILHEAGALHSIHLGFRSVSEDRRVQAIIITWLFGAFIEGAAGFGTPAALLSPLLVSMGFPALAAVMVALITNTTPISFATVGLPTVFGLGTVLGTTEVRGAIEDAGMTFPLFIYQIGVWTAVLHSVMALIIPLLAITMMTRFFGERRSFREGLEAWPYAVFAGLSFVVPFMATAWLLGPEFPTLAGGLVGLLILLPATKAGFLVPRNRWDFPDRKQWDKAWIGSIPIVASSAREGVPLWKAWSPYIVVGILLVFTRVDALPFKAFFRSFPIRLNDLLHTGVVAQLEPAYNPGLFPLIVISLLSIPFFGMSSSEAARACRKAWGTVKSPALALLFTVPLVEAMQAGHSLRGWEGMPIVIARFAADIAQGTWPLVAPFVGAFGAFLAGSNTVSNMLFGLFQYSVADRLGISHILVVSLQNVGGAFGVLICVFKIVAACATVGLGGQEGLVIRRNFIPLLMYGGVVGLAGLVLVYWIAPTLF